MCACVCACLHICVSLYVAVFVGACSVWGAHGVHVYLFVLSVYYVGSRPVSCVHVHIVM